MLILGIAVSTAALLAGLGLSAYSHHPLPSKVLEFRRILAGLRTGSPAAIVSLGILLLIATPVLALFGCLIQYLKNRDWRYAAATTAVLLVLAVSVLLGGG